MNIPFSQWTKEQVCGWLDDYGLGQYVNLTRQWVENGQTLLSATPQDFEKVVLSVPLPDFVVQYSLFQPFKCFVFLFFSFTVTNSSFCPQEMGMKNPLHRKKLQLALNAFTTKVIEKSAELDYIWVTRKTFSTWNILNFTCCMFSFESHL